MLLPCYNEQAKQNRIMGTGLRFFMRIFSRVHFNVEPSDTYISRKAIILVSWWFSNNIARIYPLILFSDFQEIALTGCVS